MKISMHAMAAGLFVPVLRNLQHILDKGARHAEARKFDPAVLIQARLAPDMFPLVRQVQIACDAAKNAVARLAGQEPPRHPDEETTFEELRARIEKTIAYVESVGESALDGSDLRDVKVPLRDRTLEFQGLDFLRKFALPNFFFHVVTAYDILRHNGVELGKRDYLFGPQG